MLENVRLTAYVFDEMHRPIDWRAVRTHDANVMRIITEKLLDLNPSAAHIYIVPYTVTYKKDYWRCQKDPSDFVECICFEDEVARAGICFYSAD